MAFLKQLSLVLSLSCLAVVSQSKDYPEARHLNDAELSNFFPSLTRSLDFFTSRTTTPKPHKEPDHTRPVYITYRPTYPYPPPPPHYWPKPEELPYKPSHDHYPYYPEFPAHGQSQGYPYIIILNPALHYPHDRNHTMAPVEGRLSTEIRKQILTTPVYVDNKDERAVIEAEENSVDEFSRNISLEGVNISTDFSEPDDTETVDTKDVKLPLDFILGLQLARQRIAQQEALVYLRNYKKVDNLNNKIYQI